MKIILNLFRYDKNRLFSIICLLNAWRGRAPHELCFLLKDVEGFCNFWIFLTAAAIRDGHDLPEATPSEMHVNVQVPDALEHVRVHAKRSSSGSSAADLTDHHLQVDFTPSTVLLDVDGWVLDAKLQSWGEFGFIWPSSHWTCWICCCTAGTVNGLA